MSRILLLLSSLTEPHHAVYKIRDNWDAKSCRVSEKFLETRASIGPGCKLPPPKNTGSGRDATRFDEPFGLVAFHLHDGRAIV